MFYNFPLKIFCSFIYLFNLAKPQNMEAFSFGVPAGENKEKQYKTKTTQGSEMITEMFQQNFTATPEQYKRNWFLPH